MLKSRLLRLVLGVVASLVLLWVVAWLAVPALIKWQLETRGSQMLGRELRVGEVRFAPHALALTLRDLSIAGIDGAGAPQLQVDRVFVDVAARSVWRLAPVVEALEIDAPRARLTRLAEGRYDIDDVLQRFTGREAPPDAEPARFALFNVRVADGELQFDDRPVARRHALRKLVLDLPFLSNLPDHLLIKVEPRLAFEFNGAAFDNRGRATPFAEGRASEFDIRFDQLDLGPMWAYAPRELPLQPAGGTLSADLNLRFEQPQQRQPQVQLKGQVDLRDLHLKTAADGAPLLAWQSLRVRLADVRPLQRRLVLDDVQIDGAVLHVRREASGQLQWQRLAAAMPRAAPPSQRAAAAGASAAASAVAGAGPAASSASAASAASAAGGAAGSHAAGSHAAGANAAGARARTSPAWQVQLASLQLKDAKVHWSDASLQPAAELLLDGIELQLQPLSWPVGGDAALRFDARLTKQGQPVGQLHAEGALTDRTAKIDLRADGIDLAAAEPYLQQHLQPRASAKLAATASLDWAREPQRLVLRLPTLQVDDFHLAEPAVAKGRGVRRAPLAQVTKLELSEVEADLVQRTVSIGAVHVQRPFVELARDKAGVLNASRWVNAPSAAASAPAAEAARPSAQVEPATEAAAPWQLALREFKLEGGRARLADAALPTGALELSGVRLVAQGLVWPLQAGATPLSTQFAASLSTRGKGAAPARIDWRGRVSPQPLAAQGQLRVERLPVHVFEPYFGAALPVLLQTLETGFQGQLDLKQTPAGWAGQVRGEALLADLRVLARGVPGASEPGAELISWNAVSMRDFRLKLQPGDGKPLIEIGELGISDYYSRVEISEDGRLNLQTAVAPVQPPGTTAATPAPDAPPARPSSTPRARAPGTTTESESGAPQVSAPTAMLNRLPIDLMINSTTISNGRVDFRDLFVRPNYSAQLSELNGTIGRLDSRVRDMATLQISGRIAGTGLLEIGGAVNPTVIPPALDIKAKAHDIELSGLTPYSAKYAGYPIERGKLSMDVAYKVEADGRLEASNQIVVNQLTFGPRTDSPDAVKLPVPLIVALLQDKHGVIDLDIPLTGSINDPQFSLGALIWKVVVNLFNKIISSPFSVIGGGKDLSAVEFRPGTADFTASGDEVLAKVAKALDDRPRLKLSIAATADPVSERRAMQQAAFEARLRDAQRRERARGALGSRSAPDAPLPPLQPAQRAELVRQIYDDSKLPDKPRNFIGMAKDIPVAEMEAMLVAAMPVDDAAARQLAVNRGRSVRDALIAKGLPANRLFIAEPKLQAPAADNAAAVPQAQLTLSAG